MSFNSLSRATVGDPAATNTTKKRNSKLIKQAFSKSRSTTTSTTTRTKNGNSKKPTKNINRSQLQRLIDCRSGIQETTNKIHKDVNTLDKTIQKKLSSDRRIKATASELRMLQRELQDLKNALLDFYDKTKQMLNERIDEYDVSKNEITSSNTTIASLIENSDSTGTTNNKNSTSLNNSGQRQQQQQWKREGGEQQQGLGYDSNQQRYGVINKKITYNPSDVMIRSWYLVNYLKTDSQSSKKTGTVINEKRKASEFTHL